ncbi:hypothetical protein GCM10010361_33700 [Streptomyces olivaceiscleroticus]|uniref:Secreted protein n=1 Tax=Streptomyces olivaceiscleroticus TaxID=68245 RepID=A0ABN1A3R8_9ACTN
MQSDVTLRDLITLVVGIALATEHQAAPLAHAAHLLQLTVQGVSPARANSSEPRTAQASPQRPSQLNTSQGEERDCVNIPVRAGPPRWTARSSQPSPVSRCRR